MDFKNLRLKRGLTLRQVESKTGISNAYLSQLENGKIKKPSHDTVTKLQELYSIPAQKESIKTIKVGNSIYVHLNDEKQLIQFSDGFERVTLSREEFDQVVSLIHKKQ